MAGPGKRGPAPGSGGRPRNKKPASVNGAGYPLTTTGPPSKGTRQYVHRVIASGGTVGGAKSPPKGKQGAAKGIVDHKNHNRADYNKGNLRVTTSSVNRRNRTK